MITTVSVVQITIGVRGKRVHDLRGFINDLVESDANIAIIHSGYIRYKTIEAFEASVAAALHTNNLDYQINRIAGDGERLVLFRR